MSTTDFFLTIVGENTKLRPEPRRWAVTLWFVFTFSTEGQMVGGGMGLGSHNKFISKQRADKDCTFLVKDISGKQREGECSSRQGNILLALLITSFPTVCLPLKALIQGT